MATYDKFPGYSKQAMWSLFLIVAFPIHVWAFILYFRDITWLTERTNYWNAIGVGAYALLFALLESIVVFMIVFLFGLLFPKRWPEEKRIALLGIFYMLIALMAITGQLYFLLGAPFQEMTTRLLAATGHPVRALYVITLTPIALLAMVSVYMVIKSPKATQFVKKIFERLSLLTSIYIVFDIIGIFIVIFRNIQNILK